MALRGKLVRIKFVDDLLSGNTAAACSRFTPSAVDHTFGGRSACLQLLATATKTSSEKAKLRLEAKQIDSTPVTLHGNTATVPNTGSSGTTTLVYENGQWLFGTTSSGQTGTGTGTGTTG